MEPNTRPISYLPLSINESISVKKTILIIATIVGCIAILWPKVLYPTFFGGPIFPTNLKGQRIYDGCCDVVIDREYLLNVTNSTPEIGLFRKELKSFPRDASVSQERPNQLHPESIYQAMRERGRSIPPAPTIPIIDKNAPFRNPMPRISTPKFAAKPGVRPPMGAGSLQQPQVKGSGMGLVMPLYTIAIVIFFIYTIMKIVLKKNCPNAPYESASSNATFRTEVFQQEGARNSTKYGNSLLVITAIQSLIDAADEQLQLRQTATKACNLSKELDNESTLTKEEDQQPKPNNSVAGENSTAIEDKKCADDLFDCSVAVLGIDITAANKENGKFHEPAPVWQHHPRKVQIDDYEETQPRSIYLEGSLPNESQVLISDSETKLEHLIDPELDDSTKEHAVVLNSKMTLSLIKKEPSL